MNKRITARYAVRETLGVIILGVALFWSAGRIDWWPGWAFLAVTAAWVLGTAVVILRLNPDLLAERLGPRRGGKRWDVVILSLLGVFELARAVIAGLDERFLWSGAFALPVQIIALLLCILGYGLTVWATASNAYFSQIVRLQAERGQTVVTGGPYGYVRHPGYVGAILVELAAPFLLGSWWAAVPSWLCAGLLILRTFLEDRTLQHELSGYADYTRKVHHRLLPGVW